MTKNMQRYGEQGWQWTDDDTLYRTNGMGEGLWMFCLDGGIDIDSDGNRTPSRAMQQVVGTDGYSLPNDRTKALRRIRYLRSLGG